MILKLRKVWWCIERNISVCFVTRTPLMMTQQLITCGTTGMFLSRPAVQPLLFPSISTIIQCYHHFVLPERFIKRRYNVIYIYIVFIKGNRVIEARILVQYWLKSKLTRHHPGISQDGNGLSEGQNVFLPCSSFILIG